jgi:uncharacterized coiled-coil protein SlyX
MNDNDPVSQKTLNEAADAILVGVKGMIDAMAAKMDAKFEAMEARLDNTDRKVDNVAAHLIDTNTKVDKMKPKLDAIITEVKAVKGQVSKLQRNTPTRDEFEAVKSKVYKHSSLI